MALRLTGLEGEHLQEASEDNEEFSLGHGLSDTDPLTNTERNKPLLLDNSARLVQEPVGIEGFGVGPVLGVPHDVVEDGPDESVLRYLVSPYLDIRQSSVRHGHGSYGAQPLYLHDGGLGQTQPPSVLQTGRAASQLCVDLSLNPGLDVRVEDHVTNSPGQGSGGRLRPSSEQIKGVDQELLLGECDVRIALHFIQVDVHKISRIVLVECFLVLLEDLLHKAVHLVHALNQHVVVVYNLHGTHLPLLVPARPLW